MPSSSSSSSAAAAGNDRTQWFADEVKSLTSDADDAGADALYDLLRLGTAGFKRKDLTDEVRA